MATPAFKKATKEQARARVALIGPSGSGKTYTALRIATGLGGRIALIDTERASASKYADQFAFDVLEPDSFHPQNYIDAINLAGTAGYDVLIIDSLTHAWAGKDGVLELVDRVKKRSQSQNSFMAWRDVTPLHNALVDAMLRTPMHLIITLRTKTEYVIEEDEKGKKAPRKIGLAPIQRDGLEYEFDVVADLNLDHDLIVSKTRCSALDGVMIRKPGPEIAETLRVWLTDGVPAPPPLAAALPTPPESKKPVAKTPPKNGKAEPVDPDPLGVDGYPKDGEEPPVKKPTAEDIKFYGAIDTEIKRAAEALAPRLGELAKVEAEDRYRKVLGGEGYEHRNEAKTRQARMNLYRAVRDMAESTIAIERTPPVPSEAG